MMLGGIIRYVTFTTLSLTEGWHCITERKKYLSLLVQPQNFLNISRLCTEKKFSNAFFEICSIDGGFQLAEI